MSPGNKRLLRMIVAAEVTGLVVVLCVWWLTSRGKPHPAPDPAAAGAHASGPGPVARMPDAKPPASPPPATGAATTASAPAHTQPAVSREEAKKALDQGRSLLAAGNLVQARAELSKAFFSGQLDPAEEDQTAKDAAAVCQKTLLSREITDGDPYSLPYLVKRGDTIEGARGIEMTQELHVPGRLIEKVNNLRSGKDLQAGQQIKLIKGPFHAIVHKGRFLMDVYLEREGLPKVFVRRLTVGLGANGSTPVGPWRVEKGQKMEQPVWDPRGQHITWNQAGYPFGRKALWIGLEGLNPQTSVIRDFGIHSTNDPASIGKANSLGCVRMSDDDIELVFSLLYDFHSRVDVVP